MTGVLLAQDVRALIISRLTDATYGITNLINTINTERAGTIISNIAMTNTQTPNEIDPQVDDGNYPIVLVELGNEDDETNMGADLTTMRGTLGLQIQTVIKSGSYAQAIFDGENYLEAILRSLQNYDYQVSGGSFLCLCKNQNRTDLNTTQGQTTRVIWVTFDIQRNKL